MCGQKFELVWETTVNEWMLANAIKVKVDEDKLLELQLKEKQDKVAMHFDCFEAINSQEAVEMIKDTDYSGADIYNSFAKPISDAPSLKLLSEKVHT